MADHPAPSDGQLSLVIPAYNEAAGICHAVHEADEGLGRLVAAYEILVVDDGSADGTADAVAELARANPHIRLLRHADNRGYGAALRTGFAAARFDRVAFTDADCQFHLADLGALLSLADEHPLAVGYRVGRQDPWQRRFFSWGYNRLVRILLGTRVRDCDCALKVFHRDVVTALLPETPGFFVNTEMLTRARQLGYRVAEAGVRHRPRLRGASKVSLADIPRTLRTLLPFWWSRVLFPGCGEGVTGAESAKPRWSAPSRGFADSPPATPRFLSSALPLLALVLAAALLFFSRLGAPLQEPDEARYAEVPRQMLAAGHWIVPVLHGQTYPDKPPLFYWLVMGSYSLFGVHDWVARLAPGGAAFLAVLLTYLWGRRTLGPRAALAGAFILCLSARFVYLGRLLTPDSLLCLCVLGALAAAHLAVQAPRLRWGWWLLSGLACGLGLLTKGPVALALVTGPVVLLGLLDPRTARPRWGWAAYLVVAAGVAVPWYAAMSVCDPDFAACFFWRHNVVRYVAPFDHARPVWFHLPGLVLGLLPWALLVPGLVRFLARHSARTAARRPAALGFFLLAFLWAVLFYSAAGCKRAVYILPAIPPLALALGCYLDAAIPSSLAARLLARHRLAVGQLAQRATVVVLAGGMVCALVAMGVKLLTTGSGIAVVLGAGAGILVVLRYGRGRSAAASWTGCGAATFLVLLAGVHLVLPAYARRFSLRAPLRHQARLGVDPAVPVACYPRGWDSVGFYLRRSDMRVFTPATCDNLIALVRAQPNTVLVVKSDGALKELLNLLPGSVEFVPSGRSGGVTVGQVRPRPVAPETLFAQRRP
jgi:dolichol-phosphate mannosyltransferase